MVHEHNITDSGNEFIIDAVTRMISKPKDIPRVVQGDHNCERIRFELNALEIEGHDMSKSDRCEIHFTNFNPETDEKSDGVYVVDDLMHSDGKVVFSWLIQECATQYWGALSFSIKFLCFAEDGTQSYEWNSLISGGIPVFPGKDNMKIVLEKYPDIYESILSGIEKETKRMAESMKYYGSADIVPSDTSMFSFVTDDTTMTATISAKEAKTITGDVVIPYKYDVGDKTYIVTAIGDEAFDSDPVYDDYMGMTSVIIPNTVTAIGKQAFYASEALESVVIPDTVTSIGNSAFYYCTALKEIVLPKLETIKYGAFACCHSLKKVVIPDGVTTIENMAFMGCNLGEMYLPKSLKSFEGYSGTGLPDVENVYYDGTEEEYNAIDMETLEEAVIHYNYSPTTFSCIRLKSPNGTIYKLTVADDGTLTTEQIKRG